MTTVRRLLLRRLNDYHGWARELLGDGGGPNQDWSDLLEAGGAVFLGWARDGEARLDGASGDGLVIFWVGIAPVSLGRGVEL